MPRLTHMATNPFKEIELKKIPVHKVVGFVALMAVLVAVGWSLGSLRAGGSDGAGAGVSPGSPDMGVAGSRAAAEEPAPTDGGRQVAGDEKSIAIAAASVIRNGDVAVKGSDIVKMRGQALSIVRAVGGTIDREETVANPKGGVSFSTLVVRVPSASFDKTMDQLSKIGRFVHASNSSEDVTTQVLDINARVRVQAASVARIERLLGRAKSLRDIVALEAEVSRRQAELDSLRSQQKWLADQTSMSTITVSMERTTAKTSTNPFVSGLRQGWDALVASFGTLIKVVGALVPWLILIVPLGFAVAAWRRRTSRTG